MNNSGQGNTLIHKRIFVNNTAVPKCRPTTTIKNKAGLKELVVANTMATTSPNADKVNCKNCA